MIAENVLDEILTEPKAERPSVVGIEASDDAFEMVHQETADQAVLVSHAAGLGTVRCQKKTGVFDAASSQDDMGRRDLVKRAVCAPDIDRRDRGAGVVQAHMGCR